MNIINDNLIDETIGGGAACFMACGIVCAITYMTAAAMGVAFMDN